MGSEIFPQKDEIRAYPRIYCTTTMSTFWRPTKSPNLLHCSSLLNAELM